MIFSVACSLGLASFFLGASFSSIFCVIFAKIFKKRYLKCRISLFCVFLAISVSFVAFFIVANQQKYDFFLILNEKSDFRFLLTLFLSGLIISSFWKFLLLPTFAFYIFFTIHTQYFLNKKFSSFPKNFSITVETKDSEIFIKVYKIHPKFLFFIERFYYDINSEVELNNNFDSELNFFQKKLLEFDNWLLKDFEIKKLEIPKARFYPALYILNFESNFDDFNISISRTL